MSVAAAHGPLLNTTALVKTHLGVGVKGGLLAPNAGWASTAQVVCQWAAICCAAVELSLKVLKVEPAVDRLRQCCKQ